MSPSGLTFGPQTGANPSDKSRPFSWARPFHVTATCPTIYSSQERIEVLFNCGMSCFFSLQASVESKQQIRDLLSVPWNNIPKSMPHACHQKVSSYTQAIMNGSKVCHMDYKSAWDLGPEKGSLHLQSCCTRLKKPVLQQGLFKDTYPHQPLPNL
eukprot:900685-Pelagomonas_calceolata.AAC.3